MYKGQEHDMVEGKTKGFESYTCNSVGCNFYTIVKTPELNKEMWKREREAFFKKHPCKETRKKARVSMSTLTDAFLNRQIRSANG